MGYLYGYFIGAGGTNMATEFLELKKLTIFVGEDFFCGDRPFYKVMLEKAAKLKLAGCTVFRGLQGYGSRVRGRERRLLISVSEAIRLSASCHSLKRT